jgi:hypothetical protein
MQEAYQVQDVKEGDRDYIPELAGSLTFSMRYLMAKGEVYTIGDVDMHSPFVGFKPFRGAGNAAGRQGILEKIVERIRLKFNAILPALSTMSVVLVNSGACSR